MIGYDFFFFGRGGGGGKRRLAVGKVKMTGGSLMSCGKKSVDGFIDLIWLGVFPSDVHLYRAARPLDRSSTHHPLLIKVPIDLLPYLLI